MSELDRQFKYWQGLRRNIERVTEGVDAANIKDSCAELFEFNVVRGEAILAESVLRTVENSEKIAPIAGLVALVISQIESVGLKVLRAVLYTILHTSGDRKRSLALLVAHLYHLDSVHELTVLELIHVLIHTKELALAQEVLRCCFDKLSSVCKPGMDHILDQFPEAFDQSKQQLELIDLVPKVHKKCLTVELDEPLAEIDDGFYMDHQWESHEHEYNVIRETILGDSFSVSRYETSEDTVQENSTEENSETVEAVSAAAEPDVILDMTNTHTQELRKTIYLVIMSAMSADEAAHKLLRLDAAKKHPAEIINMLVESNSQEKNYNRMYGNVGYILSKVSRKWRHLLGLAFSEFYSRIHHYETAQIRNIGSLFGNLLALDAIDWTVLETVQIIPSESTPSNRILLKALFEELKQELGMSALVTRLNSDDLASSTRGIFPTEDLGDLRFAINYFTAINMGSLTDRMRSFLENF